MVNTEKDCEMDRKKNTAITFCTMFNCVAMPIKTFQIERNTWRERGREGSACTFPPVVMAFTHVYSKMVLPCFIIMNCITSEFAMKCIPLGEDHTSKRFPCACVLVGFFFWKNLCRKEKQHSSTPQPLQNRLQPAIYHHP